MIKKIFVNILFILFTYCSFGQKIISKKKCKMEKININQFQTKDLRINETYKDVLNDSIIEYGVREDHFIQNTYVKNSPYHSKKQYHKSNYQLKSESDYFFNIPIGKLKKFDESGLLLEEIEWNKIEQRTFSIDELINKMNKEFNINLLNAENKNISRSTSPFTYIITIGNPAISSKVRRIIVNGQDGSVISDEEIIYTK